MRTDVIDIFRGNDIRSYDALVAAGVKGIIHKASEGSTLTDTMYAYRRKAQGGRFLWGAYHFNSESSSITTQVNNFVASAKPDEYTLMCLDWEGSGAAFTAAHAREFLNRLMDITHREPQDLWIYGGNVLRERITSDADMAFFGKFRNWHCQYGTSHPNVCKAWPTYNLWQYSETGSFNDAEGKPATGGLVDLNVFNGTFDEMRAMWAPAYRKGYVPPKPSVPIVLPQPAQPAKPAPGKSVGRKLWEWWKTH